MYNNQQINQNTKIQTNNNNNNNNNKGNNDNNGKDDPNDKDHSLIQLIRKFLDTRTETVLTFAAAVAIATAFKDLILSVITNIMHPLIIKLLLLTKLNNYINISALNTSQDIVTNLSQFIINILSFISILVITYYLFHIIINSN
jgi:large-conductance mechanosensitive channel